MVFPNVEYMFSFYPFIAVECVLRVKCTCRNQCSGEKGVKNGSGETLL